MYDDFVKSMTSAFNKNITDHVYNHFAGGENKDELNKQSDRELAVTTEKMKLDMEQQLNVALYGRGR